MCVLYIHSSTKDLKEYFPKYIVGVNCCVYLLLHLLLVHMKYVLLNKVKTKKGIIATNNNIHDNNNINIES